MCPVDGGKATESSWCLLGCSTQLTLNNHHGAELRKTVRELKQPFLCGYLHPAGTHSGSEKLGSGFDVSRGQQPLGPVIVLTGTDG